MCKVIEKKEDINTLCGINNRSEKGDIYIWIKDISKAIFCSDFGVNIYIGEEIPEGFKINKELTKRLITEYSNEFKGYTKRT